MTYQIKKLMTYYKILIITLIERSYFGGLKLPTHHLFFFQFFNFTITSNYSKKKHIKSLPIASYQSKTLLV